MRTSRPRKRAPASASTSPSTTASGRTRRLTGVHRTRHTSLHRPSKWRPNLRTYHLRTGYPQLEKPAPPLFTRKLLLTIAMLATILGCASATPHSYAAFVGLRLYTLRFRAMQPTVEGEFIVTSAGKNELNTRHFNIRSSLSDHDRVDILDRGLICSSWNMRISGDQLVLRAVSGGRVYRFRAASERTMDDFISSIKATEGLVNPKSGQGYLLAGRCA